MPNSLVVTAFNIRSLKLHSKSVFLIKLKYLLNLNSDILVLTEANTNKSDWNRAAFDYYRYELSNHNFFLTEPEETGPQRRGILLLFKKNLGLKVTKVEQLNYNLVKLVIEHTIVKLSI